MTSCPTRPTLGRERERSRFVAVPVALNQSRIDEYSAAAKASRLELIQIESAAL